MCNMGCDQCQNWAFWNRVHSLNSGAHFFKIGHMQWRRQDLEEGGAERNFGRKPRLFIMQLPAARERD